MNEWPENSDYPALTTLSGRKILITLLRRRLRLRAEIGLHGWQLADAPGRNIDTR